MGETAQRPTATQLERQAVERLWAHWLRITGKRQRLDSKRTRILRSAVLLVGEESVKLALTGLSRSPHHLGQNEQRKTYMEVRYALKGIGDESDDERIFKAIAWATVYAPGRAATLDPDKALRYLDEVRQFVGRQALDPSATTGRDRAVDAFRKLAEGGYAVEKLDRSPWARFASA